MIFHTSGVINIEIGIIVIIAHPYQHEFAAKSANGPAIKQPKQKRLVPGQDDEIKGIW